MNCKLVIIRDDKLYWSNKGYWSRFVEEAYGFKNKIEAENILANVRRKFPSADTEMVISE